MECTYCGAELEGGDAYGYLAAHQLGEVLGHTFKCPNAEGFDTHEEAIKYLIDSGEDLESLGLERWESVQCESSTHNVSGSFYTDLNGNLKEGYPC